MDMVLNRKYFFLFIFFTLLYLGAIYLVPPDPAVLKRYNISGLQLNLINTALLIPIVAIWFTSFYGFSKIKHYSEIIKKQPDGKAIAKIANGLGILSISFPFNAFLDVILAYTGRLYPAFTPAVTIASNYITILLVAISFVVMLSGARELRNLVKSKNTKTIWSIRIAMLLFGIFYAYLTLINPLRSVPGPDGFALYYLPDPLIILTIVLPTLYTWYAGIEAAVHIQTYKNQVQGILYKDALKYMSWGLIAVILSSILLQVLNTFSTWLLELELGSLVQLLYFLLVCIGIGFIFIAKGAKKLTKIEEI